MTQLTEKELMLQEEEAQAQAAAEADNNAKMEAEIKARQTPPQQTPVAQEMQDRQSPAEPQEGGFLGWARNFGKSVEDNHPVVKTLADTGKAMGDLGEGVVVGAANAGRNSISSSLGASELVNQKVDDLSQNHPILGGIARTVNRMVNPVGSFIPQGTEQKFDQFVPEVGYKDSKQALIGGATEFGLGMVGPNKGITVEKTLAGLPKLIARLGKYVAVNAGGVAATSPETKTLVTGDNNTFGNLLGGVSLDANGNYSEELMRKRLNILAEASLIAKPAELAVGTGAKLAHFVYDLTGGAYSRFASMGLKEQEHAASIVRELDNVTGFETPKELEAIHQRVADKIRAGADVKVQSDIPGVDSVNYKRPTAEAYAKGAAQSPEGISPAELSRARGQQSSAVSRGLPNLDEAVAQPSLKLEKAANQTREVFGGQASVENSRQGVLKSAKSDMDALDLGVADKQQILHEKELTIGDAVKQDPYLRDAMDSEDISLGLRKRTNDAADNIVDAHNTNKSAIEAEKTAKYDAISDKMKADMKSFNATYEGVKDYVPSDIQKLIEGNDGTYGYLKKQVLPEINQEINDLYTAGKGRIANKLQQIRDNINNDQMAALESRGATKVAANVKEANRFFKEEVAPNRQGLSDDLSDIQLKNKNRPDDAKVDSRKALKATFDDPDQIEHTRRVLQLANKPQEATNYILGNVAEDLQNTLTSKGAAGINPEEIAKSLRPYHEMLPPGESTRLTNFVNELKSKKGDVDALTAQFNEYKKGAEAMKKNIQDKELSKFFTESGLPVKNPDDVFHDVMSGKYPVEELSQIQKRLQSQNNPDLGDGLKSTYAKFFKEKVFRNGETRAGSKNVNSDTLGAINTGKSKILDIGDAIHGKDSTVMKIYRKLLDEANTSENFRSAPKSTGDDISKYDKGARQGTDFLITQAFGQLNRWGSRLRSVTGKAIAGSSSKDDYLKAMDAVMSDPNKAADLIEFLGKRAGSSWSKEDKKRLFQWGVNSKLYKPEDEKKLMDNASNQTDDALAKK